jgi:hypothetical protein
VPSIFHHLLQGEFLTFFLRLFKSDERKQNECKEAFIFVRKVESENGITLPYTFIGTGQLQNPRKDATTNGSILYDIHLDSQLPDDLMEDFQWIE